MLRRGIGAVSLGVSLLLVGCGSSGQGGGPITVSAAADLSFAFQELAERFEQDTGTKVILNFGSTGQLAQQIEQGAPVDVFAAADTRSVEELERKGRIVSGTTATFARGFIVIWVRKEGPKPMANLTDLLRSDVRRVAIANPDHAPYGRAAREALQSAGVWEAIQPKLVLGDNIRQTLIHAETGNVDVAIVALALALQTDGRWVRISEELYGPIDQAIAVVRGTRREPQAKAFVALVRGLEGRAVLAKYGFEVPG